MRPLFIIAMENYPYLDYEVNLQYLIKYLKETMGREGTIPCMMVFVAILKILARRTNEKDQEATMRGINATRAEMEILTAEMRIKAFPGAKIPLATRYDLKAGENVRV